MMGRYGGFPLKCSWVCRRGAIVCDAGNQETMTGPIMNLDEVEFDDVEDTGYFTSECATMGARFGARKLGGNPAVPPPGWAQLAQVLRRTHPSGAMRFAWRTRRALP